MTREEIIEVLEHPENYLSIAYQHSRAYPAASSRLMDAIQYAADALKVGQDVIGCEFCRTFDFSEAKTDVGKYGTHIFIAGGSYRYPPQDRFHYCPMCGRKLIHTKDMDV